MKKTIVKVLAIVFVVSILVSSMFVMTGAACSEFTMRIDFYDAGNYGETGCALIGYTYNSAKSRLEVSSITINSCNLRGDSTDYFKKLPGASDLKFDKKKGYFEKTLIAVNSTSHFSDAQGNAGSSIIDAGGSIGAAAGAGFAASVVSSAWASIEVHVGKTMRAPRKGDRVVISISDTHDMEIDSTISYIVAN